MWLNESWDDFVARKQALREKLLSCDISEIPGVTACVQDDFKAGETYALSANITPDHVEPLGICWFSEDGRLIKKEVSPSIAPEGQWLAVFYYPRKSFPCFYEEELDVVPR